MNAKKMTMLMLCATWLTASGMAIANEDFTAAWEAAEAKRKEAAGMGAEWRDTGKMLKSAKEAAEKGDVEKAMMMVAKADEQSADAIAQFKREGELWQARVPK